MGIEDRDYFKQKQNENEKLIRIKVCPKCWNLVLHESKYVKYNSFPPTSEGDTVVCSYCECKYRIIKGNFVELK